MLASVVIPTRNLGGALEPVVRPLWEQSIGPSRFEIIVIDNASADETEERTARLRALSPVALRYHRMDADRGPAVARNAGARVASVAPVVFLDSDVELEPCVIEVAVRYLERDEAAARPADLSAYPEQRVRP